MTNDLHLQNQINASAAEFWNRATNQPRPGRHRWWQSPTIIRHINAVVCGQPLSDLHAGFHRLIADNLNGQVARRAVSVGCGAGHKEQALIQAGFVQEFHLYEISSERIAIGRRRAARDGFAERMHFIEGDAFALCTSSDFDLVYWNNALHHMPDAGMAIRWSVERLRPGGIFAMDDFIGPSRFQWTEFALSFANRYRSCLPHNLNIDPKTRKAPPPLVRPSIESMIAADPSEAADSSQIIKQIIAAFPDALIKPTGGAIYHTALNDILANFDESGMDLRLALLLDDALRTAGENHYAVAIACKSPT